MKTEDYKENCMNKYNETRLLLCSGIHEVKALFFLLIFYISLDFPMERHRKSTTEGVIPLGLTNSLNFCILRTSPLLLACASNSARTCIVSGAILSKACSEYLRTLISSF
ncbi:hypothetical protein BK718_11005 [Bacillus thuringiensis serovar andalousiensis]|uniref:Uncharacterized protein n=1 Tax=Bacillus thuringiensis TaxID=1428 RepID=A0A9X6KD60_BACTU|nr:MULTISPECIES: hypothetical protein [Bacillus cereus group]OTX36727.1 hypothetical protein BK718_11005 [Bacillus thuringiensis serovar andalousiensis]MDA2615382.1 hypothetical protein [Bacillus cereus]MDZ3953385.1 hypothetical protein [Bacillus thuringiensis]MEB8554418.1 hypothetical protein [Bacillus cereus]MEB8650890.1 hypothetical protein [Bacillus cereus]